MIASALTLYVLPIIQLLAGLGAFLIAVKITSDSMSRLANSGIRRLFQKMGPNKLAGVGVGAVSTALIHSSAVTTVMVIGLVNAGVMSLAQATAVIMGANVGTTITAQIAALGTFDFMMYVCIITFVGFLIMSIAKNEKWKSIGYLIAGLGLIFLSLQFMKSAFEPIATAEPGGDYYEVATSLKNFLASVNNPVLLLLVGIVLTFCLQSSTALTTILISMASAGLIVGGATASGDVSNGVLFVILGSNIGTCFTSLVASAGANANAKRAATIHLLFNLFGSLIFFVVLVIWDSFMADTFAKWFSGAYGTQIAMFHTFFNVLCTALFLPFSKLFVKLASFVVKDKKDDKRQTQFLDERFLSNPSVALEQARLEARRMGDLVMETCDIAMTAFEHKDLSAEEKVVKNIETVSEINDKTAQYLVTVSSHSAMSVHNEKVLSALYYVLGDVMRIADIAYNVTKYTKRTVDEDIAFSQSVYPEIAEMYDKIKVLYGESMECLLTRSKTILRKVEKLEDEVDAMRKDLVERHIERLNRGECNPNSNGVYINLVGNLERMADHMTFIAESILKI